MTYFFYRSKKYQDSDLAFVVCLCVVVDAQGLITNSKFKLDDIPFSDNKSDFINNIKAKWPWAFNTAENNIFFDSICTDVVNQDEDVRPKLISKESYQSVLENLETNFNKEIGDRIKEVDCPSFIKVSSSEIISNLLNERKNDKILNIEKQVAVLAHLVKICCFLAEEPAYVYEFPLYLEYIKKHSLTQKELSVEDFIERICSAINCQKVII